MISVVVVVLVAHLIFLSVSLHFYLPQPSPDLEIWQLQRGLTGGSCDQWGVGLAEQLNRWVVGGCLGVGIERSQGSQLCWDIFWPDICIWSCCLIIVGRV